MKNLTAEAKLILDRHDDFVNNNMRAGAVLALTDSKLLRAQGLTNQVSVFQIRDLIRQYDNNKISISRMAEIINGINI